MGQHTHRRGSPGQLAAEFTVLCLQLLYLPLRIQQLLRCAAFNARVSSDQSPLCSLLCPSQLCGKPVQDSIAFAVQLRY
jgi:hypothetical protein